MKRFGFSAALALFLVFTATAPAFAQTDGAEVYAKYCSQCHGDDGRGLGVAMPYVKPAPRDFTAGKYKIRRTPTGQLPLDEDLIRVVKVGLPYTSMPAFEGLLSGAEIEAVVEHVKSFSEDFQDPEYAPEGFPIPEPPPYTPESVERGKEVYAETGCERCHGAIGYGDGMSAPTLTDDWGVHIRAADLSMPWTFRGGGTRRDIYRTMSSGFNGTPMPGFYGSLPDEDIWAITDYIVSLSGNTTEAPYGTMVRAMGTEGEIDLALGAELFAGAEKTLFPVVGQIVEKGRNFYPSATSVSVQAIYNPEEIAVRVTWHDMRAEIWGTNAPDLPVPAWEEQENRFLPSHAQEEAETGDDGGDFWGTGEAGAGDSGGDDGGDFWGTGEAEDSGDGGGGDFWGTGETEDSGDGGDDFWGTGGGEAEPAAPEGPDVEFSDAVALQLPITLPSGVRKPYFLFGDAQNPVELWFADLARENAASSFIGRGSSAIAPADHEPPQAVTSYENGEWSVIFKRERKLRGAVAFEEDTFIPVAVSVWDGFNRERGNKRGLTAWYHLYLEPLEKPSPVGPMVRAALIVLGLEILLIAWVRWRHRKQARNQGEAAGGTEPAAA